MHPQESEDLLIQRAIRRDGAAFAALYDMHMDRVYNHIYYRVPSQADAEDIAQDVFLKVWKAISKYRRTGAPFVAWLIAIARNLIADYYKKRKKLVSLEEMEASGGSVETSTAKMAETGLDQKEIREVIFRLKGDKKKVILMHFIDGFSYEEIAKLLHKSEGAVRVIQYRALNDLRRMVGTE